MPSGAIMARKEDTWPARVGDVEDWDVDHVVVEDRIDKNVPVAGNQVSRFLRCGGKYLITVEKNDSVLSSLIPLGI